MRINNVLNRQERYRHKPGEGKDANGKIRMQQRRERVQDMRHKPGKKNTEKWRVKWQGCGQIQVIIACGKLI